MASGGWSFTTILRAMGGPARGVVMTTISGLWAGPAGGRSVPAVTPQAQDLTVRTLARQPSAKAMGRLVIPLSFFFLKPCLQILPFTYTNTMRGGVSAAHIIKFYSVAHCLPLPPTPWPTPTPFTPTYPQSVGAGFAGATRTYPSKKQ